MAGIERRNRVYKPVNLDEQIADDPLGQFFVYWDDITHGVVRRDLGPSVA